jgi:hypothetical protein
MLATRDQEGGEEIALLPLFLCKQRKENEFQRVEAVTTAQKKRDIIQSQMNHGV